MKREEAIFYLKEIQKTYALNDKQVKAATNMAIEALSAEAKTKCIAQIKVDTEEIVRRIKEEHDMWIPSPAVRRR